MAFTLMAWNRDNFIDKSYQRHICSSVFISHESYRDGFGTDPQETILNAFKVFDPEGTGVLRGEELKYHLVSQADKFTEDEVNHMFTNFPPDVAGNLDYRNLCYVITHSEGKEQRVKAR